MRGDGLWESGVGATWSARQPREQCRNLARVPWAWTLQSGSLGQVTFIRYPALSELAQGLWLLMPMVGSVVKAKAA